MAKGKRSRAAEKAAVKADEPPAGTPEASGEGEATEAAASEVAASEVAEEPKGPDGPSISEGSFETATRALLGLTMLALPLVWDRGLFDLFDGAKRFAAHVMISLALVLWASSGPARGTLFARASRLAGALAALLAIEAVSLLVAVNAIEGLIEMANRLLWLGALMLGVQAVGRRTHLNVLLGFGMVGATIASAIGIAQATGWSPHGSDGMDLWPQVCAPASIFGNKNMAAEYVLLYLPLAGYAACCWTLLRDRILAGIALGVCSAFLCLAGTRATYVAVAVTTMPVLVGLADVLLDRAKESFGPVLKRRLVVAVVTVLVTWGGVGVSMKVIGSCLPDGQRHDPYGLASNAMNLATFSSNWRLIVWANTLAMIRDHPVLGVGVGNWRFHYPRYHRKIAVDPDFNSRVQADTPHNDWVQTFAETGLIGMLGLGVWLLTLGLAFWQWLVRRTDGSAPLGDEDRLAILAVGVAALAYGIDGCFSFPMMKAAPTFVLFILLGGAEGLGGARRVVQLPGHAAAAVAQACATFGLAVVAGQVCWVMGDVNFKEGLNLYNQGRVLEAHERLSLAYRFRPFDPSLAVFHGGIAHEMGKTDEALAINLRAKVLHPNFTNVINQLGNIYWKKGQLKEAEDYYKEVLDIHPDFTEALRNLASLYIATGRLELARTTLERLVERDPDDPAHQLDLGEVYRALKKRERARDMVTALLKRWPDNARAMMALAHLSREEKKYEEAERLYRRALEVAPATPPRYFLATLLAERGRVPEAKIVLNEALKADPKSGLIADAIKKLATTGMLRPPTADIPRVVESAETTLRERLALEPRSAPLHYQLADVYLNKGRFEVAGEELQRSVEVDPRNALAWAKLAKLASRNHDSERAESLLRKGLEALPGDQTLWNELGLVYQSRGERARALEAFERAASGPNPTPEVLFNVGAERARAGHPAEAIDALKKFLEVWKGDPNIRRQAEDEITRLTALMKASGR